MNAKRALCLILAAFVSACAGAPTWDTNVFPYQMAYGGQGTHAPVAVVEK